MAARQKRLIDFDTHLKRLGSGAFGQVTLVRDKETQQYYAMKVLSKAHIMREKKLNYVMVERDAMSKLNHPNIVRLSLTFQDKVNLYYVCEYAAHGDLQTILNDKVAMDIPQARVIIGQILLATAHMHKNRILHRDLKPENILLDDGNRVKITDFGTAKIFKQEDAFMSPRGSFVGSADYVAPEVLKETELGPSSDLWSLGCIIYALLVGQGPFHSDSNYAIFQLIEKCEYTLPDFLPEDAKDLITKMLKLEPSERLGHNTYASDYETIRNHPFFDGINWETLPSQTTEEFHPFPAAVAAREKESRESAQKAIMGDEETIEHEGIVHIRDDDEDATQMMLILTSKGRLVLTDVGKLKVSGEIELTSSVKVMKIDDNTMRIEAADEAHDFVSEKTGVDAWVEAIVAAIPAECDKA